MYASRYGTPPAVGKTGGLAAKVTDTTAATLFHRTATGFVFEETTSSAVVGAIDHALALYRQPLIGRRLQLQAMSQDFSWGASAAKYVEPYWQMLGFRVLPGPLPHQAVEGHLGIFAAT
jgi:starch synthase